MLVIISNLKNRWAQLRTSDSKKLWNSWNYILKVWRDCQDICAHVMQTISQNLGLCFISENMFKVFARIVIWGYVILKTVISISNQILNASAHMGISTFENYKHEHQIVRKASRFCAHGKKNIWRNRCHDYMNATAIQNIFGNNAIIIWKSEYTFSTSASIEKTKK